MKKNILTLFLLLMFSSFILAVQSPSIGFEEFCISQEYSKETINETDYCIFTNTDKCDIKEFYTGKCGINFNNKNPTCVEKDESVWPSVKPCCENLEPYLPCGVDGQQICRKTPNFFKRLLENLICLFK